jgi:3-phenylpropionate/trans-cinnamate dioxygenase ferredoxin reductase subunit
VHYLRTLDDVERIRAGLAGARRVVVIGGGFIGMEVAAVLIQRGHEVTVLEAGARILGRSVDPMTAGFLESEHARRGVRIVTGATIAAIEADGAAHAVLAADGRRWPADLIIAGVGVAPRVELAAEAGLVCDDGIVVDENALTSDPRIVAAGDCTRHPNARLGRALRLETVHNAVEQARTAAATLCGRDRPYRQVPWVWSDQFDLRFQAVGAADGSARSVVRGSIAARAFAVFMFDGERLLGVNCVNRPHDFAAARRLLNEGVALAPAAAADPGFDLRRLLGPRPRAAFEPPWPALAQRRRMLAEG